MDPATDSLKWFFRQPAPRQVDESLLNEALDVILPKVARVVFYLIVVMLVAAMATASVLMITMTDLKGEWRMLTGSTALSSGKVLDVKTQKGSKGTITYVYTFEFTPHAHEASARPARGVSFSGSKIASPGDVVQIEYIPDDPKISRIAGCRMSPLPFALIIALPFLGMTIAVLPIGVFRYKKRWLHGLLVSGVSVPAAIEKVKPGPKGSLVVEIRYYVDGLEVKSKTNLSNLSGRKHDREWFTALQESGQPVTILVNRNKPKSFFLLELLYRTREKNSPLHADARQ